MDKKNKIKTAHAPSKPQSPDYRNKNRIVTASIEINNIKRYLQSVKNHENVKEKTQQKSESASRQNLFSSSRKSDDYQRQEVLRKRISQLQFQNNEFRMMEKDYDALVIKNHELQQKMLMLLSQLQLSSSERGSGSPLRSIPLSNSNIKQIEEYSTIQNVYTEQSSKELVENTGYPKAFKNEGSSAKAQQIQPFKNVTLDKEGQPATLYLRQNKQIKQYIDEQLKSSMQNFQAKFINYIQAIEQQMCQMKATNQQLLKLKLLSSYSSQNQIRMQVRQNSSKFKKQQVPQFYMHKQKPLFNTPEIQHQQSGQHDNSLVNIEMDIISDSQHSFGKSHRPNHSKLSVSKPFYTPDSYSKIQSASSQMKHKSQYSQSLMNKVLQSLFSIRENLTFLLGQQAKANGSSFLQFENRIFEQIKHILATFFPFRNKPASFQICGESYLDSLLLRSKTNFLKKDEGEQSDKIKQAKEIEHSQNSKELILKDLKYSFVIPSLCSQQFQATQGKLIEIIDIMKAFNQQYRQILQKNGAFRGKSLMNQYPQSRP